MTVQNTSDEFSADCAKIQKVIKPEKSHVIYKPEKRNFKSYSVSKP